MAENIEGIRISKLPKYMGKTEPDKIDKDDYGHNYLLIDDEAEANNQGSKRVSLETLINSLEKEKTEVSEVPWDKVTDKPDKIKNIDTELDDIKASIPQKSSNDTTEGATFVTPEYINDVYLSQEEAETKYAQIDDDNTNENTTWSSSKINTELENQKVVASDIYDAESSDAMSGKAVASAINGKANSTDLGALKFRIEDGAAQYTKDDGESWINFRNPVGTANANQVLTGVTFANSSSDNLTGTMPNNGAYINEITEKDEAITIPEGYHNGNGYIKATYTGGNGFCVFVRDGAGTVVLSDLAKDIKTKYDYDIDPNALTVNNFLIVDAGSSIPETSWARNASSNDDSEERMWSSAVRASYTAPTKTISGGKLTVTAGKFSATSALISNHSYYTSYYGCNAYKNLNPSLKVYLFIPPIQK